MFNIKQALSGLLQTKTNYTWDQLRFILPDIVWINRKNLPPDWRAKDLFESAFDKGLITETEEGFEFTP